MDSKSLVEYEKEIAALYAQSPSYQVVGGAAYHPGMKAMEDFDALLSHPHSKYKVIHVAGTNGKGSTSHLLASVLMACGLKVGLFTSPHLLDFRERIKLGGEMIPREDVLCFLQSYKEQISNLSFFEITSAMAFWYFAKAEVDVAIIEVGLGGRLDSTNIVSPILSIVTSIGLDHCDLLGDTLEKIAFEKGGIIKPGVPVVLGNIEEAPLRVLREIAGSRGAEVCCSGDFDFDFDFEELLSLMDLKGSYQRYNLATVLVALGIVFPVLGLRPSSELVVSGIVAAARRTGFRGRWEKLSDKPLIYCDIAHNPQGVAPVMEQLMGLFDTGRFGRLVMIFGMVSNKDVEAVACLLPKDAEYIFTNARGARALAASDLARMLSVHGLRGVCTSSVKEALELYRSSALESDLVYIGGSSYVVAEALEVV